MTKRIFSVLSLLIVASMLLAACGGGGADLVCEDEIGCVEVADGEAIHLAYMLTISGGTAALGEDSLGAIQIALADRGEILGHSVELTGEDSGCSAEGGQTAATKVSADPTVITET